MIKMAAEESGKNTPAQSQWMKIVKYLVTLKYVRQIPKPVKKWRLFCYRVAVSNRLDNFIMMVIFLNAIEITTWWYGQKGFVVTLKERCNLGFSAIFLVRAAYIQNSSHNALHSDLC